ncbi:MAG: GNAT family N-acetyltransferase [Spirochaetales bacterium]|nr:GNAT family N-acetyltransferase [Spirochaetales bacterium]
MTLSKNASYHPSSWTSIRFVQAKDEKDVERICHSTFYGGDGFPLPSLIGYLWSTWYVRYASEHSFVGTDSQNTAVGYALSTVDTLAYLQHFSQSMTPLIQGSLMELKRTHPQVHQQFAHEFRHVHHVYHLENMKQVCQDYPAHIHVDILPGFQGQGLGKALMNHLLCHLDSFGVKGSHLIVGDENKRAVKYYQSSGYTILLDSQDGIPGCFVMGRLRENV